MGVVGLSTHDGAHDTARARVDGTKDFVTVCMFAREQQDAEFAAQSDNGTVNADILLQTTNRRRRRRCHHRHRPVAAGPVS